MPHAGSSLLEFPWAWKGLKPPTGATPFVRPPSPPPSSIAPARKRPPSKKPLSQVLRERWDESAYQDLNGEGRHGELSPEKRKLANRKIEVDERGFAVRPHHRAARRRAARSLPPPLPALFTPAPDLCNRLRGAHRPDPAWRAAQIGAGGDADRAAFLSEKRRLQLNAAAGKIQRHFLTKIRTKKWLEMIEAAKARKAAADAEAAKDAERHINAGPLKAADEAEAPAPAPEAAAPEAAAPEAAPAPAEEVVLPEGFTAGGKPKAKLPPGWTEGERNGEPAYLHTSGLMLKSLRAVEMYESMSRKKSPSPVGRRGRSKAAVKLDGRGFRTEDSEPTRAATSPSKLLQDDRSNGSSSPDPYLRMAQDMERTGAPRPRRPSATAAAASTPIRTAPWGMRADGLSPEYGHRELEATKEEEPPSLLARTSTGLFGTIDPNTGEPAELGGRRRRSSPSRRSASPSREGRRSHGELKYTSTAAAGGGKGGRRRGRSSPRRRAVVAAAGRRRRGGALGGQEMDAAAGGAPTARRRRRSRCCTRRRRSTPSCWAARRWTCTARMMTRARRRWRRRRRGCTRRRRGRRRRSPRASPPRRRRRRPSSAAGGGGEGRRPPSAPPPTPARSGWERVRRDAAAAELARRRRPVGVGD